MQALSMIFADHAGKPSFTRTMGAFLVLIPLAVWALACYSAKGIVPIGDAMTLIAFGIGGPMASNVTTPKKAKEATKNEEDTEG